MPRPLLAAALVLLTLTLAALVRARRAGLARLAAERELARRDELTGSPNRRAGREALEREHERIRRGGPPAALLLLDVDHFKQVNDRHGYARGDQVLQELVRRLGGELRKIDLLCRWGGEEFVVLAPATGPPGLQPLAEKLRRSVKKRPFVCGENQLAVSISVGATLLDGQEPPQVCLQRANLALQQAKQTRDAVAVAALQPELEPFELLHRRA